MTTINDTITIDESERIAKVELALKGLINPDDLSTDEQELYLEKLSESYWAPSPTEDKFYANLRARGGMDESVALARIHTKSTPQD